MSSMNEYNRRQYELMLEAIRRYEANGCTLATLVHALDGLISVIETESETDRNELLQDWGPLEEVHALCLEVGKPDVELVHIDVITKAIANLKATISKQTS